MTLRDAWEAEAGHWIAWAREPGHDSYWRFHRDAFLPTLPPPPAAVLDLGCGEGRLPRDLRAAGYSVVAIDGSPTLIEAARAADPTGDYRAADAAALPIPDESVDIVTAFMTPQDFDDLAGVMLEAARVLRPGGHLRTATVHPINSAGRFASHEPDAPFVIQESYFETRQYADTIERGSLPMTFTSRHRDLEELVAPILAAGLLIDRIAEIPDWSEPPASRWRRIPLFLHVGAIKPA